MDEIIEWLTACIDRDEAIARALVFPAHNGYKPHPELSEWSYGGDEVYYTQTPEMLTHPYAEKYLVTCDSEGLTPSVDEDEGAHIARHDPARVLREVSAYRAILELHRIISYPDGYAYCICQEEDGRNTTAPCTGIKILVSIYADQEGYREEWAL